MLSLSSHSEEDFRSWARNRNRDRRGGGGGRNGKQDMIRELAHVAAHQVGDVFEGGVEGAMEKFRPNLRQQAARENERGEQDKEGEGDTQETTAEAREEESDLDGPRRKAGDMLDAAAEVGLRLQEEVGSGVGVEQAGRSQAGQAGADDHDEGRGGRWSGRHG